MHPCRKIKLRPKEEELLELLGEKGSMSFQEVEELTGYRPQEREKRMRAMQREGLIRIQKVNELIINNFTFERTEIHNVASLVEYQATDAVVNTMNDLKFLD